VLAAHQVDPGLEARGVGLVRQPDHGEVERRLRAAQIIGARAVGDVAVAVDQPAEVVDHVLDRILAAIGGQAQQGEVAVPVVHLAEAPAGHHERLVQGQGAVAVHRLDRRAGQHRPQGGDVGLQGGAVLGRRRQGRALGHDEIGPHEALELGVGEGRVGAVGGQDLGRRAPGRGVDEGLAVREQLAHLHLVEQLGIGVGGGGDLAGLGGLGGLGQGGRGQGEPDRGDHQGVVMLHDHSSKSAAYPSACWVERFSKITRTLKR
jgi:hypothetical protein